MSYAGLLVNQVTIEKRSETLNEVHETIESFDDTDTIAASVQEQAPQELSSPDVDGPLVIDAVIFTLFREDIEHLDILRRVDISPERRYRVIYPKDAAGRGHHLEIQCQRIWQRAEEVGS